MHPQQIRELRAAIPFVPFRVLAKNGTRYDVRDHASVILTGNGRMMAIAMSDHVVTLDLLLVTGIQRPIPPKRNGRRGKR